jgi:hypothetical protein
MQRTPGKLSQLAFEAIISHATNARELTDQAAAAFAENPDEFRTRPVSSEKVAA